MVRRFVGSLMLLLALSSAPPAHAQLFYGSNSWGGGGRLAQPVVAYQPVAVAAPMVAPAFAPACAPACAPAPQACYRPACDSCAQPTVAYYSPMSYRTAYYAPAAYVAPRPWYSFLWPWNRTTAVTAYYPYTGVPAATTAYYGTSSWSGSTGYALSAPAVVGSCGTGGCPTFGCATGGCSSGGCGVSTSYAPAPSCCSANAPPSFAPMPATPAPYSVPATSAPMPMPMPSQTPFPGPASATPQPSLSPSVVVPSPGAIPSTSALPPEVTGPAPTELRDIPSEGNKTFREEPQPASDAEGPQVKPQSSGGGLFRGAPRLVDPQDRTTYRPAPTRIQAKPAILARTPSRSTQPTSAAAPIATLEDDDSLWRHVGK